MPRYSPKVTQGLLQELDSKCFFFFLWKMEKHGSFIGKQCDVIKAKESGRKKKFKAKMSTKILKLFFRQQLFIFLSSFNEFLTCKEGNFPNTQHDRAFS